MVSINIFSKVDVGQENACLTMRLLREEAGFGKSLEINF